MAKIDLSRISRRSTPRPRPILRSEPPAVQGADDLSRLREIIFGSFLSEYEQQIARIETRVAMEASKVRTEVAEIVRQLEGRIAQVDARAQKAQCDLRQQILSQSNLLSDAIQEHSEQAIHLVEKGLQELRVKKIDRTAFSTFLDNLRTHLDQQSAASGSQR